MVGVGFAQSTHLMLSILLTAAAPDLDSGGAAGRQEVDLIEINHFVDDQGREVFRQLIFYDWSSRSGEFHVRAWRLIKHDRQLPRRRWNPDHYQCNWWEEGRKRVVWSKSLRETWTQEDPERVNRAILPESQRVPLWPDQKR
ncbi:MAG: hypothetical protein AAGA03_03560 [Planctomycetota bacterium]